MRYARRMNGYSEVPHNGEINNYLRKDLDAKATAKNTACWNLLGQSAHETHVVFLAVYRIGIMRRGVAEAQHVAAEGFLCDGEEQGDPLFIGQCRLSHMECKVQQYRFLKRRNLHASHGCVDTVCPISQPH